MTTDLQYAVDASEAASRHAQKLDNRLRVIEETLIPVLRASGWSLHSLRQKFPHLSVNELRALTESRSAS